MCNRNDEPDSIFLFYYDVNLKQIDVTGFFFKHFNFETTVSQIFV